MVCVRLKWEFPRNHLLFNVCGNFDRKLTTKVAFNERQQESHPFRPTVAMTSQSYYKDRLGFDPHESIYDERPVKSSKTSTSKSKYHHEEYVQHHRHHSQKQEQNHSFHQSSSPSPQHHHQQHHQQPHHQSMITTSTSKRVDSNNSFDYQSKKQKPGQGGYEDALTQFKGTMTIWQYFVEDWDIRGTWTLLLFTLSRVMFLIGFG